MNKIEADRRSEKAREASRLANLWLEHPYVAHAAHELAASGQEQVGNQALAAEHRRAAQYWAKRELDANNLTYKMKGHRN